MRPEEAETTQRSFSALILADLTPNSRVDWNDKNPLTCERALCTASPLVHDSSHSDVARAMDPPPKLHRQTHNTHSLLWYPANSHRNAESPVLSVPDSRCVAEEEARGMDWCQLSDPKNKFSRCCYVFFYIKVSHFHFDWNHFTPNENMNVAYPSWRSQLKCSFFTVLLSFLCSCHWTLACFLRCLYKYS